MRAVLVLLCCVSMTFAAPPPRKPKSLAKKPAVVAPKAPLPLTMPYGMPPEIGDRGRLVGQRFKVVQVANEGEALIRIEWYTHTPGVAGRDVLTYHEELAWLRADTTKLIDGRLVTDKRVFRVTGKHKYNTLTGPKTVIVLEPESEN